VKTLTDIALGAAIVALIAIATRWIFSAKSAQNPAVRNGANVYGLKWQIRAVSYLASAFSLLLSIEGFLQGSHSEHWPTNLLFVVLAAGAFWFGSGVVVTDETGITKKSLWKSQLLRWDEISQIKVHKRDAGAIELRAGSRKLIVDSRFVAPAHLLREIEDHAKLSVVRD
jgi:hypothetical protein